jgi:type II secretion system protein H
MGNQKGFTLAELVVTLAVLAIVAAIAIPAFQRYAINGNLKAAARDIASDIGLLKERAMAENRMYQITLSVGSNSYTLQQCNAPGSPCAAWTTIQVKNLTGYASDIRFDSGETIVTNYVIQPRGTATTGAIVLRNSRGSKGTVTIFVTGRQNVQFNMQ